MPLIVVTVFETQAELDVVEALKSLGVVDMVVVISTGGISIVNVFPTEVIVTIIPDGVVGGWSRLVLVMTVGLDKVNGVELDEYDPLSEISAAMEEY